MDDNERQVKEAEAFWNDSPTWASVARTFIICITIIAIFAIIAFS